MAVNSIVFGFLYFFNISKKILWAPQSSENHYIKEEHFLEIC